MFKKKDVLEVKKAELGKYQKKFNAAVAVVTSAIEALTKINEGIEKKLVEIVTYQDELEKTRTGLLEARDTNERVIKNFSSLLNAE